MAGSGHAPLRDRPDVLLEVEDLTVEFPVGRNSVVHAVSGISFDVAEGETLGIVGESGCGKSTTARSIIRLNDIRSGHVRYQGTDLAELEGEALRKMRPDLQMIFQDPISSLNPRRKIRDVISEGLAVWGDSQGAWSRDRIEELMEAVGIDPQYGDRRPHQFSGGQCQRIGVARALALDPKVLICDEPVSALDVSVQAQILNLLEDMKQRYGLTLLFISHDLSVVKNVSDRIMVMYAGKACEIGNADELYEHPRHPYTRALLASIRARAHRRCGRGRHRRRPAVTDRSTRRLSLPHAVPARVRPLPSGRAADAPDGRRSFRGLPPPRRGRRLALGAVGYRRTQTVLARRVESPSMAVVAMSSA